MLVAHILAACDIPTCMMIGDIPSCSAAGSCTKQHNGVDAIRSYYQPGTKRFMLIIHTLITLDAV